MKKRFRVLSMISTFVLCVSMFSFAASALGSYDVGDKTYVIDSVALDSATLGMRSSIKDSESTDGTFYLEPAVKPVAQSNYWLAYDFTVTQGPENYGERAHVFVHPRFGYFAEQGTIFLEKLLGHEKDGLPVGSYKGIIKLSDYVAIPQEGIVWYGTYVFGGALFGGNITVNQYELVTVKEAVTAKVTFKDHLGNVYTTKNAVMNQGSGFISQLPALPQRRGYITTGWNNFTTDTIVTNDIIVTPSFTKDPAFSYSISSTNGTLTCAGHTAQDGIFTVNYEDRILATAPETDGSNAFSYWTVNGIKMSTNRSFLFYASGDAQLTAVYQGTVETAPYVSLNTNGAMEINASSKFDWTTFAQTSVPAGYTLKECGVLFAAGDQTANLDNFKIGTALTTIKHVSTAAANQQYIGRLLNIGAGKQRSARAYMIVTDANSVDQTFYSENAITATAPVIETTFDKPLGFASGPNCVTDGVTGKITETSYNNGTWAGLEGEDLTITVPLGQLRTFNKLNMSFLMEYGVGVNFPASVTYSTSTDGTNFAEYQMLNTGATIDGTRILNATTTVEKTVTAKYIRVFINYPGPLPAPHPAAGLKTWVFFDELSIIS